MGGRLLVRPVTVGGTSCTALVDSGSSATLVRPDVVGSDTAIFPTLFKLQTVTGEHVPMVGEALVTLGLGRKLVRCPVWVADLEDCILGLDVLGALDCVINTKRGTLTFPDSHVVQMHKRFPRPPFPLIRSVEVLAAENITTESAYHIGPHRPPPTTSCLPAANFQPLPACDKPPPAPPALPPASATRAQLHPQTLRNESQL